MAKRPYPRWQTGHGTVLKWVLENPRGTNHECAIATGYSPSHISRIKNSPEFKQRYRQLLDFEFTEIVKRRMAAMGS